MKTTATLAGLGALVMFAAITYGFAVGDFATEGRQIMSIPWGIVSVIDLYVGFALFSAWILFRQGSSIGSWLWIVLVMTLGSLAICLYVLNTLRAARSDWKRFFMGQHARPTA